MTAERVTVMVPRRPIPPADPRIAQVFANVAQVKWANDTTPIDGDTDFDPQDTKRSAWLLILTTPTDMVAHADALRTIILAWGLADEQFNVTADYEATVRIANISLHIYDVDALLLAAARSEVKP